MNRENNIYNFFGKGIELDKVVGFEEIDKSIRTSPKKLRIKFGIDPTSPLIHLGNAIPLWKLKSLQDLGHQIVLIIGDFTARIGDPSDKLAIRQPLSDKQIKENMKTYKKQIGKILDLKKVEFHYNSEWLKNLSFKDILDLASQFTVAQILERENFTERYKNGKPIGLHEFLYPLMQGYDSVGARADIEIGGTDQIFNMLAGRIIQPFYGQPSQNIIPLTLIEGLDGRKMSKSFGNIIAITDSPSEMFGKTMSLRDELIQKYFNLCTRLSDDEINEIITKNQNPRDQKAKLAKELVNIYYGEKEAQKAEEEFNKVHRDKELPSEIETIVIPEDRILLIDIISPAIINSRSEARRIIEQGGIKINGEVQNDWKKEIPDKKEKIIQVGKRIFKKII